MITHSSRSTDKNILVNWGIVSSWEILRNVSYILKINAPGVQLKVRMAFGSDTGNLVYVFGFDDSIISMRIKNVDHTGKVSNDSSSSSFSIVLSLNKRMLKRKVYCSK